VSALVSIRTFSAAGSKLTPAIGENSILKNLKKRLGGSGKLTSKLFARHLEKFSHILVTFLKIWYFGQQGWHLILQGCHLHRKFGRSLG
jgi:hypothetical protein